MPTFWLEKHFVTIGAACFASDAMLEVWKADRGDAEVLRRVWALKARSGSAADPRS